MNKTRLLCLLFCCFCLCFSACKKAPSATTDAAQTTTAKASVSQASTLLAYVPSNVAFVAATSGQYTIDQLLDQTKLIRTNLLKNDTFKQSIGMTMAHYMSLYTTSENDADKKAKIHETIQKYMDGNITDDDIRNFVYSFYDFYALDRDHAEFSMFQAGSDFVFMTKTKDTKKAFQIYKTQLNQSFDGFKQYLSTSENNKENGLIDKDETHETYATYTLKIDDTIPNIKIIVSALEDRLTLVISTDEKIAFDKYDHAATTAVSKDLIANPLPGAIGIVRVQNGELIQLISKIMPILVPNVKQNCFDAWTEALKNLSATKLDIAAKDKTITLNLGLTVSDDNLLKSLQAMQGKDKVPHLNIKDSLFNAELNMNLPQMAQFIQSIVPKLTELAMTCNMRKGASIIMPLSQATTMLSPLFDKVDTLQFALLGIHKSGEFGLHISGHELSTVLPDFFQQLTEMPLEVGSSEKTDIFFGTGNLKTNLSDTDFSAYIAPKPLDQMDIKPFMPSELSPSTALLTLSMTSNLIHAFQLEGTGFRNDMNKEMELEQINKTYSQLLALAKDDAKIEALNAQKQEEIKALDKKYADIALHDMEQFKDDLSFNLNLNLANANDGLNLKLDFAVE